jgi:hypothetical protein
MKFLKGLLIVFLFVIIVGGVGFLGYQIYTGNINGMDMSSDTDTSSDNQDRMGMDMSTETKAIPNPYLAQNREKLSDAIASINKAVELITIDPYSKATVPDMNSMSDMSDNMGDMDSKDINIYQSGNSSVSITSEEEEAENADTTTDMEEAMGTMDMETDKGDNYVYDQSKLEQLHNGIYCMAQGILTVNDLGNDLLNQSMQLEEYPLTYQSYVTRYNVSIQNRMKLEEAINLLSQASVLVNVNPYASSNGYSVDGEKMLQIHEGIYDLAQGMAGLNSLLNDFNNQMYEASISAQNAVYSNSTTSTMDMSSNIFTDLFDNISISTVVNILIIILVIGLVIGIFGMITSVFKSNKNMNHDRDDNNY